MLKQAAGSNTIKQDCTLAIGGGNHERSLFAFCLKRITPDNRCCRHRGADRARRGSYPNSPAICWRAYLFEDLVHYKPSELASIATDAWAFIPNRAPGTPKLSIQTPNNAPGSALNAISVLTLLNDDMPFLVNSVMAELSERGISAQLVAHPILVTERDAQAQLASWHAASSDGAAKRESFIHLHLERMDDEAARGDLLAALEQVLADVRMTVQDWRQMLARVSYVLVEYRKRSASLPGAEIDEAAQFSNG